LGNKKKKGFSKKLLIADYAIAVVFIVALIVCLYVNGIYTMETINKLIDSGIDVSMVTITPPFNLDVFGVVLGIWIAQLGLSSGAYYMMAKSEHKIELPMALINDLPREVKENIDLTQVIISVLSCTDN
jgi:hypothetical protein